jgi:ABC-type multidrug transport system ATPase subunit
MSKNGVVLSIESLNRRFGEREVVRSLSLAVEPGQRVALWGPNGSGKSTVLRCVAGTLTPSAGSVHVGGHEAGELAARRLVGASLSQERSFYLRLSGRTNLLFFARMRYDDRPEGARAVDALIEELEIADIAAQRVDRCSTGMVQQLALARALLGDPVVLLLDEPTRSLDADARHRLWGALDRRPKAAALIATHLDEDVELCDERVSFPV